jgi:hypothetical protein
MVYLYLLVSFSETIGGWLVTVAPINYSDTGVRRAVHQGRGANGKQKVPGAAAN